MTETQILQQFLDERVDALNRGHVIDDDFEHEAALFEYRKVKTADKVRVPMGYRNPSCRCARLAGASCRG